MCITAYDSLIKETKKALGILESFLSHKRDLCDPSVAMDHSWKSNLLEGTCQSF